MYIKKLCACLLSLLLTLTLLAPCAAFAEKAEEAEEKTVRVGWYESTFCYHDAFGRRCGIVYEYQQRIAAYTGWNYEYVEDSWPNLMQKLIDGEIDLMSDVSYTEDRAAQMLYSALPMGEESYYIYIDADNTEITLQNTASFNGKRIGVNRGSFQEGLLLEWIEKNDVSPVLVETTGNEAASLTMLADGELDAFVSLDSFGAKERCVPVCKIGASDYFFVVSNERPDLLSELNSAMNTVLEEDPYFNQRLNDDYINLTRTNAFLTAAQQNWLEKHGTIRVGYRNDYLPFCAQDKTTGELDGALRDFLSHASNCLRNVSLTFEAVPFASSGDALAALMRGEIDCVFPVNLSSCDGENMGVFCTNPIMKTEVYVVLRSADAQALAPSRVLTAAVNAGNINYITFLEDYYPEWKTCECRDTADCFNAIASGRADCVLISNYRVFETENYRMRYKLSILPSGETMGLALALRRGDHELFSIMNKVVNLSDDEDLANALLAYAYANKKVTFADFLTDNWVGVFLLIISFFTITYILLLDKLRAERKARERQMQIDTERLERQREQQETLERELRHQEQLRQAMELAYTDSLTRVKSKHAYLEAETRMNRRIEEGDVTGFGVAVFDLNDLKRINDTRGHEVGDQYLVDACKLICSSFLHSQVYRIGGDEFAIVLEGEDYAAQDKLLRDFESLVSKNLTRGEIVVASGSARFHPGKDQNLQDVFERADERMYRRKRELKEQAEKRLAQA